jgi:polysaccharide pyruvyl transferase WcaK-like protein
MQSGKPRIGININPYGESFIKGVNESNFSEEGLLSTLSKTVEWIYRDLGAEVWLFATQHMDVSIVWKLQDRINLQEKIHIFSNRKYTYSELTGLFSKLDILIGMRTHAIILASSVGTPVIGIVTYPKTYGYLDRIGQANRGIRLQDLELDRLQQTVRDTWEQRTILRQQISEAVETQRKLAWGAAEFLAPYLN